jgi:hypothetical protein
LAVVLGFASNAEAQDIECPEDNYTIRIGEQQFGFCQWVFDEHNNFCVAHAGPFGEFKVPFTATQGVIGFCLIVAMLVIVPACFTVRWKKKQVAQ